jgi:hypothetical protein
MIDNNRIKRNNIVEIIIIKKKEKDLLQRYDAWFKGDNLYSRIIASRYCIRLYKSILT